MALLITVFSSGTSAFTQPSSAHVIVEFEDLRSTEDGSPVNGFGGVVAYALHDGTYRTYRTGEPAGEGLRHFANEASIGPWLDELQTQDPHALGDFLNFPEEVVDGRLSGSNGLYHLLPPEFDPIKNRYFSFIMKVCPSDDAFISNEDPRAIEVFDEDGRFLGPIVFEIFSDQVMDAGTRPNDEQDLPCFDRLPRESFVDSGERTQEPVHPHPGFNGSIGNPDGVPVRILGGGNSFVDPILDPTGSRPYHVSFDAEKADFTRQRQAIARVRITSGIHGGFSGSYYDPTRSGEGFAVEVSGDWPSPVIAMSWYTYRPDGSGEPMFLFGAGPAQYMDGAAEFVLYQAEGGAFASTDNPTNAAVRRWGTLDIQFEQPYCERMTLSNFQPDDPQYVLPARMHTVRLTPLLSGFAKYCGGTYLVPVGRQG